MKILLRISLLIALFISVFSFTADAVRIPEPIRFTVMKDGLMHTFTGFVDIGPYGEINGGAFSISPGFYGIYYITFRATSEKVTNQFEDYEFLKGGTEEVNRLIFNDIVEAVSKGSNKIATPQPVPAL
ncbi:hypothetical protein KTO58_04930 [Chitinophaga pendula]|uniref:hypothetical protein n=1 Tax=Chitinophaga TaxID=79328 RepID=UPI000BAEEA6C|nr:MULTISPECIES: hypothetical protein [Chitinophaga]ASZ13840.1 hypothetical protein CK934_24240 [Chitinophaga sp. MD30]UCJ08537.1 hypothetical protein KTO58_04930 [Chitinophaga pendula]